MKVRRRDCPRSSTLVLLVVTLLGAGVSRGADDAIELIDFEALELAYGTSSTVGDLPEIHSAEDDGRAPREAEAQALPEAPEGFAYVLPFGGQGARERGYELPLPIGVSLGGILMSRDVKVKRIAIGVDGDPDLDLSQVVAGDVSVEVQNVNLRVDAWLLPFLNVYGIVGHTFNESDIVLTFKLPNRDVRVQAPGGFNGPTWGYGAVLAGGYEWWFITLDATKTKTKLDGFDAAVDASVYSARTGWNGDLWGHATRLWLGLTYWDIERRMVGEVPLPDGGTLTFDVTQGPVHDLNPTIGGNFQLNDRVNFVLDYGFNFDDVQTLILSANARF